MKNSNLKNCFPNFLIKPTTIHHSLAPLREVSQQFTPMDVVGSSLSGCVHQLSQNRMSHLRNVVLRTTRKFTTTNPYMVCRILTLVCVKLCAFPVTDTVIVDDFDLACVG